MQLVDFAGAFIMLNLPHPLLARDIDRHRIRRGLRLGKENTRAPREHDERQTQWNDRPDDFEDHAPDTVLVSRRGYFVVSPPVLNGEKDHQKRYEQREER